MKKLILAVLACTALWGNSTSYAICLPDDNTDDLFLDTVLVVKGVDVVATKRQEIISAQTISGVDLERLNSQSVADALRYFSGVQIKDYGGIGGIKTVNIRSMGTNHVGVFYNGVQLGNAQNGPFLCTTVKKAIFFKVPRTSALQARYISRLSVQRLPTGGITN